MTFIYFFSREEKSLQDRGVLQHPVESNTLEEDWWQERAELIQKDDELKRILEMPRQELRKMISLRQEKEKLERKIRYKKLFFHQCCWACSGIPLNPGYKPCAMQLRKGF